MNALRVFPTGVQHTNILKGLAVCRTELHDWARANQVASDPKKDSVHILSKTESFGSEFKILGVVFDSGLPMPGAVNEVVTATGWKLRTPIKTKNYYSDAKVVTLCKAHLLDLVIEPQQCTTLPGIYWIDCTVSRPSFRRMLE